MKILMTPLGISHSNVWESAREKEGDTEVVEDEMETPRHERLLYRSRVKLNDPKIAQS